MLIQT